MNKRYYPYEEFKEDVKLLANQLQNLDVDALIGIARGGLTLTHALASALELRSVYSINSIGYEGTQKLDDIKVFNIPELSNYKSVILVDDIVDSGETIEKVLESLKEHYPNLKIQTLSIFYKDSATHNPDFKLHHADEWIEFFWELDYNL